MSANDFIDALDTKVGNNANKHDEHATNYP